MNQPVRTTYQENQTGNATFQIVLNGVLPNVSRIDVREKLAALFKAKFKNAPVQAVIAVHGGAAPSGDPCGSQHYHGFIGMEDRAVADVTAWINHPTATAK